MTDLKMTALCAKAMGFLVQHTTGEDVWRFPETLLPYDPLHDDAQAMELLKRFNIALGWNPGWAAFRQDTKKWCYGGERDLNYTICLCVADMQAAK